MKSDQRNTSTLVLDEPEDARFVGTPSSTTLPQQPAQGLPLGNIVANTAGFALAFAAWVVFGPSVRFIAKEFHLSVQIATLIKTLPILSGAVMRIPLGVLSDRLGARLIFPALLITCGTGTYCASYANSGAQLIWLSLAIGVAGSTFIVGVQSVSSWTPKEQRGFALGLFGSGNVGTALTTFGLPLLLGAFGWRGSFRTYAVVLGMAAVVYFLVIRNVPQSGRAPSLAGSLAPLKTIRTWRFGLYYMATFGVFVATTLTVADIYIDGYHVSTKAAGLLATTFTFSASLIRMVGGKLSDKFGARLVTRVSLLTITLALLPVAFSVPLYVTVILVFVGGLAMGIGSAGVYRYIPDYYPQSVGAVGGVVGALGALGGFLLPQLAAAVKSATGSTYFQILPLVAVAIVAAIVQFVTVKNLAKLRKDTLEWDASTPVR
jgi:NNP family nitrate/nitrite transporter-like MFS transporter